MNTGKENFGDEVAARTPHPRPLSPKGRGENVIEWMERKTSQVRCSPLPLGERG